MESIELKRVNIENFQRLLNQSPAPETIFKTFDKKADDLPVSYVEMKLDELFFGQWSVKNFKTYVVSNEVVGELELEVLHPVTGMVITRTGAGAIVITADATPNDLSNQQKNAWALNPQNKKPNALDMTYPKLKAECLKNAAKSLGKIFGRDLNRKEKVATYKPNITGSEKSKLATITRAIDAGDHEGAKALMRAMTLSPETKEILTAKLSQPCEAQN
jgi:hypothetical protein